MDTHLKERLVGAAVLVAAAVILIPEMLSGPKGRNADVPAADRPAGDAGIKTYTIDLGAAARSGADENAKQESAPSVVETPVPPPESAAVAAVPATLPRKASEAPAAGPTPTPAPVVSSPSPATAPPEPAAVASRPAGKQSQSWAVQVGSFANPATADKLGEDLKRRGYASFVVPFKSGAQTLYRVRVGPMQDRKAADAIVQKLKREGTGATVVANS